MSVSHWHTPGLRESAFAASSWNVLGQFLAVLGLCSRARAFSSWGEQWLLFVVVCRLLIAGASLVVEMDSTMWPQELWHMDLVAINVGSSWTRD